VDNCPAELSQLALLARTARTKKFRTGLDRQNQLQLPCGKLQRSLRIVARFGAVQDSHITSASVS
jgi:hypothetical protein